MTLRNLKRDHTFNLKILKPLLFLVFLVFLLTPDPGSGRSPLPKSYSERKKTKDKTWFEGCVHIWRIMGWDGAVMKRDGEYKWVGQRLKLPSSSAREMETLAL